MPRVSHLPPIVAVEAEPSDSQKLVIRREASAANWILPVVFIIGWILIVITLVAMTIDSFASDIRYVGVNRSGQEVAEATSLELGWVGVVSLLIVLPTGYVVVRTLLDGARGIERVSLSSVDVPPELVAERGYEVVVLPGHAELGPIHGPTVAKQMLSLVRTASQATL